MEGDSPSLKKVLLFRVGFWALNQGGGGENMVVGRDRDIHEAG